MQIIHAIFKNADMAEGRGPMLPTGTAFTKESDAVAYIEKQSGVMGLKGEQANRRYGRNLSANSHEIVPIVLFLDLKEALREQDEQKRNIALQKLTQEERRLLGLC